jgi:hypothetical protein
VSAGAGSESKPTSPRKEGNLAKKLNGRGRGRYDVVLALAAEIAWHGVETLEEQLELFGLEVRSLDSQQIHDLVASYRAEEVNWKFFTAHADAVSDFARRQGLSEGDSVGDEDL